LDIRVVLMSHTETLVDVIKKAHALETNNMIHTIYSSNNNIPYTVLITTSNIQF